MTPRTQLVLVVIVGLGLVIGYWQFLYSPLKDQQQKLNAQHNKLAKENRDLKEQAEIQSAMVACKPELDSLNRQNELMLPVESEAVAFLKVLTNLAGAASLRQGSTKKLGETTVNAPAPKAEGAAADGAAEGGGKGKGKGKGKGGDKAATAAPPPPPLASGEAQPCWERVPGLKADQGAGATFVRVPYEIEVRGTFHQLIRYFWIIHENANNGRIITIENLTLDNPKPSADGILITAKFTAVGFRESDAEGKAAASGGMTVLREASAPEAAGAAKAPAAAAATPAGGKP
jgi:Tfp pilus assembly protein PilO